MIRPYNIRNFLPMLCGMAFLSMPIATYAQTALDQSIGKIANEWDNIKYRMQDKNAQIKALKSIEAEAKNLASANPNRAEPKIWEGIALSTEAGLTGGISALSTVKQAKTLFVEALAIDDKAMNGGAHTSLGSLYYMVPGWPIAFGDHSKAEKELKTALAISPDDIDANYFYGDFLVQEKKYTDAIPVLEKAMSAPGRPDRAVGDAGRKQDIKADLVIAQKMATRKDDN